MAEIADVCGVEDSGIVLADDAFSTAAEKIVDLAVGEGEVALSIEDVDEIGTALCQGVIAGLGYGKLLDGIPGFQSFGLVAQLLELLQQLIPGFFRLGVIHRLA